eukprot:TRINITY_DN38877_c0_g1_i1.p1 TRINITY_DN38877_c0_g1~~TRINITY_DN38877_c0_g1_i1.p1  ORF type:complete len:126 (+),score=6.49 TRINITY_DN38877_c0_g1_i1:767-1144(+)
MASGEGGSSRDYRKSPQQHPQRHMQGQHTQSSMHSAHSSMAKQQSKQMRMSFTQPMVETLVYRQVLSTGPCCQRYLLSRPRGRDTPRIEQSRFKNATSSTASFAEKLNETLACKAASKLFMPCLS